VAQGGWYPDPSGARGRFRYWDGDAWSETTTTDPTRTPPPNRSPNDSEGRRSGNRGWLVALIVLAILTAVAVIALLFSTGTIAGARRTATADTNSSTPTVSAWDETSTPTQTTPPPTIQSGGVWVDCPVSTGQGNTRQTAGHAKAAGLTVTIPKGWWGGGIFAEMSMVYDGHGAERTIPDGGGFWSSIGVGLASNADGFVDIATTAQQAMQCWSMTYHPREAPVEVLIAGESMTVSGRPAWHVEWHISYTQEPIPGEVLDVIAVDMGPDAGYVGVYWSCRPVDNPDFQSGIQSAMDSLVVA